MFSYLNLCEYILKCFKVMIGLNDLDQQNSLPGLNIYIREALQWVHLPAQLLSDLLLHQNPQFL